MIRSRFRRFFLASTCAAVAVCFLTTVGFVLAQEDQPKPPTEQKTLAENAAEKTADAAQAAADATSEAAHKVAKTADKAYQSAAATAEKAYDSAAETTQKAFQSAATTTEEAAGAAKGKAVEAAESIRHTVNRPVTETEAERNTTNALFVLGGVLLATFLIWMVYRSLYPREIPPGERTRVDHR